MRAVGERGAGARAGYVVGERGVSGGRPAEGTRTPGTAVSIWAPVEWGRTEQQTDGPIRRRCPPADLNAQADGMRLAEGSKT